MRTVEEMVGLTQGYIKPAPVAWFSSHRHGPDGGNEPYAYAYLFAYAVDIPAGTKTLTLPVSERIRILAITLSDEGPRVLPAQVLTDYLER
jgi:alpha-mannosidase